MLDRERIAALLEELDVELAADGIRAEMFVVGGAAMALAFNTRRATRDIDAVFEPKAKVYEAAAIVQAHHADLDDGWLNDAVKGLLLGADPSATVAHASDALTVKIASPGYLFALKAAAARVDRDADDIELLYRELGFGSAGEAFEFLEATFPDLSLLPRTQYLIEDIADIVGK